MAIVLKFLRDGDIRRTRVASLSLEEIHQAVQHAFPEMQLASVELKYRDDEDDLCMLNAATCADFAALFKDSSSVRIDVAAKPQGTPWPGNIPPPVTSAPEASTPFAGLPPQFPPFLQHIFSSFQGVAGGPNQDGLATLFVHFAPMLLQQISANRDEVDKLATKKPEMVRGVLQALREGLEPFPQMQEANAALERILQTEDLQGLAAVLESVLGGLTQLPAEQQRDIASIAFGGVLAKLLPTADAMPEAEGHVAHHAGIVCDGCGMNPIQGSRFKCADCPDYDLCGDCHLRKDEIHPGHSFDCKTQPDNMFGNMFGGKGAGHGPMDFGFPMDMGGQCGFPMMGKGFGKALGALLGKGKGFGKGKCKGAHGHGHRWWKGCGKGHGGHSSGSSDMSSTSESEKSAHEACENPSRKALRRDSKREMKEAKRSYKKQAKEAKKVFKAEQKAAKKAYKDAKKSWSEAKAQNRGQSSQSAMDVAVGVPVETSSNVSQTLSQTLSQTAPLSYPVEVGDGRQLTISWNRDDSPEEVATKFAIENQIGAAELPSIIGFIQHANNVTAATASAELQHAAAVAAANVQHADAVAAANVANDSSEAMDVSDAKPIPPPYTGCHESQLQALEDMGFTIRELNMSLLVTHNGDMQKVLEQLLL